MTTSHLLRADDVGTWAAKPIFPFCWNNTLLCVKGGALLRREISNRVNWFYEGILAKLRTISKFCQAVGFSRHQIKKISWYMIHIVFLSQWDSDQYFRLLSQFHTVKKEANTVGCHFVNLSFSQLLWRRENKLRTNKKGERQCVCLGADFMITSVTI